MAWGSGRLKAYIEPEKCLRCDPCPLMKVCNRRAIFQIDLEDPAIVEVGVCNGCGACVSPCKGGAVSLRPM